MMTDETEPMVLLEPGRSCCRLCLAPENECVSIYANYKTDKASILKIIEACVNIKITSEDLLSKKICHFCISYLNCWQLFKNRCISAQQRQLDWVNEVQNSLEAKRLNYRVDQTTVSNNEVANGNSSHLPFQVKEEPIDDYDENRMNDDDSGRCDFDPTQFLATDVIEDEELRRLAANKNLTITKTGGESGPQILTSLGLHSIGNENISPFAFLSASLGASAENLNELTNDSKDQLNLHLAGAPSQKPHDCRICKMKFSTRANARRHERNLHGLINDTDIPPLSVSTNDGSENVLPKTSASTPKNVRRKSNVTALMTPEMMGIYDYETPEKYRHLLTPQKLAFIEEFEDFLKQYQTQSCKCCNKVYPKYKNFMAHMRKKFPKLPRASCFKCLKQFESKAMFVSHVKRKNCINLYKLFLCDPTFEKFDKIDKLKAKELLGNKFYECKICPKEFRLKLDFRNHVNEDHMDIIQKKENNDSCVFCNEKIEDSAERKRHYNNLDCIATIRCGTCENKYVNHQQFLEHVYRDHAPLRENNSKDIKPSNLLSETSDLKETEQISKKSLETESVPPVKTLFHSRMPQNCKICGAHYNNYNNVLRHMESKHPDQLPQTYKCSLCYVGFPRLSNLREHMWEIHNRKLAKPKRDSDISCSICLAKFQDKDSWVNHQTEEHDRYVCCICFSQYDNLDIFTEHLKIHTSLARFQNTVPNLDASANNSQDSTKYAGRYDYVLKDLMTIANGGTSNNENSNSELSEQQPLEKKIKLENENQQNPALNSESRNRNLLQQQNVNGINTIEQNQQQRMPITFNCKLCEAVFNSSQGLSNHMRAHNAQEMSRRVALAWASGENATKDRGVLANDHISTGNMPGSSEKHCRRMRCRLCQKRFSSKKGYRRHMLIDHQVQNVQFIHCARCGAEFAHEKGLKVHMMKVHGEFLKDLGADNLQFECEACSIVYKTEAELMAHKKFVHKTDSEVSGNEIQKPESTLNNIENNENNNDNNNDNNEKNYDNDNANNNNNKNIVNIIKNDEKINRPMSNEVAQYWFQCRYCASNFDSNKKLAIHINVHDEFDSSDYSCKDCGNVYSGRKSLWVHRYKKHPVLPSPTLCDMCNKMFFTKDHLELHIQNLHNNKNYNQNSVNNISKSNSVNKLLNNENNERHKEIIHVSGEDVQTVQVPVAKIPKIEVPCTICHKKFSDEEEFTKHMKIHEESFYTDNPLASMFDTEPEDPDVILQKRINENGEFVCDICPKTFQQLTALKVHRNWHFRSDGKQVPADPTIWRSFAKKRKRSLTPIKCPQCSASFVSTTSLKRHISEVHKDAPNKATIFEIEKPLQCKKCNFFFNNHAEWINHKINDAKNAETDAFDLGCEICGNFFIGKDNLLQHMSLHLKEIKKESLSEDEKQLLESKDENEFGNMEIDVPNEENMDNIEQQNHSRNISEREPDSDTDLSSDTDSNSNSDSDSSSDDDDNDDEDDDEDDSDSDDENQNNKDDSGRTIEEEADEDDEHGNDDYEESTNDMLGVHSCDLCQITFDTAQKLAAHVPTHFFHAPPPSQKHKEQIAESSKHHKQASNEEKTENLEKIEKNVGSDINIKIEEGDTDYKIEEKLITNQTSAPINKVKDDDNDNSNLKFDRPSNSNVNSNETLLKKLNDSRTSQIDKMLIDHNDLTIKQEISNFIPERHLRHSIESIQEILSDSDEDMQNSSRDDTNYEDFDENDDENRDNKNDDVQENEVSSFGNKYQNAQQITLQCYDEGSYNSNAMSDCVGEEIVHDDDAEYHEHNIIDANSFSDSNHQHSTSAVSNADSNAVHRRQNNDNDNDAEGFVTEENIQNFEHFIDDEDDDEDDDDDEDEDDAEAEDEDDYDDEDGDGNRDNVSTDDEN